MSALSKCIVWIKPNGFCDITTLFSEAKFKNETDDNFIQREIAKLKRQKPNLDTTPFIIKTRNEIKQAINLIPNKQKRSLRITQDGVFYYDNNYKTPDQILQEKKQIVREKLKLGEQLNDNDIDLILK